MMKAQIGPLGLAAAITLLLPAAPAPAAVVNVDFEQPGDATHAGANGVLSSNGTAWNCVLFDTDASGLADESAATTAIDLVYTPGNTPNGPFVNLGVFNDLQDSGVLCEGFEIRNLAPDSEYTLAVYGAFNTSFSVEHASGWVGGPCTGFGPGFSLPGTEGQDYCVLSGLVPMELSPGVFGLRVANASGPILGLQLEGSTEVVEPPAADEDAPVCWQSGESEGPPRSISVTAQDSGSGLAQVNVMASENAEVGVPAFAAGTTEEVIVEIAQADGTLNTLVRLELVDRDGNSATHDFEIQGTPEDPEEPVATTCDELLAFFDEAIAAGTLEGNGPGNSAKGRRGAMRHMLVRACELFEAGQMEDACSQLRTAAKKCNGSDKDFVTGEAAPDLAARLMALSEQLCQNGDADGTSESATRNVTTSESEPPTSITWGLIKTIYEE